MKVESFFTRSTSGEVELQAFQRCGINSRSAMYISSAPPGGKTNFQGALIVYCDNAIPTYVKKAAPVFGTPAVQ
jgi:hypothetical protein